MIQKPYEILVHVIDTIGGAGVGAWFASKVNKSLKSKFEELSLWLLGLDNDNLSSFATGNKLVCLESHFCRPKTMCDHP